MSQNKDSTKKLKCECGSSKFILQPSSFGKDGGKICKRCGKSEEEIKNGSKSGNR